jgi:general secretion pathway protein J
VNRQRGMTLIEIMIAMAILAFMMALVYSTTSNTTRTKRTYESLETRMREVRVGLARVTADLEATYLSKNEDVSAFERRTMLIGKDGGDVDELTFSTFAHQQLWSDGNESDQTVVSYFSAVDREDSSKVNWLRREQRRLTNPGENAKEMAAETDIVMRDITHVDFEFWDWKDQVWKVDWDTTKADGQKDRLPTRVRITVKYKVDGIEEKISTQARLILQEAVESRFGTTYERGNN